jgi:hypothetical protein
MKPEDFKAALSEMPKEVYDEEYEVTDWFENNYPKIIFALRLAEKVLSEPSEEMNEMAWEEYKNGATLTDIIKSVVSQAVKEIETCQ